jgi:actin-related protein 5
MGITSVQSIIPARNTINASEQGAAKPSPKIYDAQERPFRGYQPPQPDGYQQSKSRPDTSAIVIDNGENTFEASLSPNTEN